MKRLIFLAILVSVTTSCSSGGPNTSAGQIPVAMQCPGSVDPNQGCPQPPQGATAVRPQGLQPRLTQSRKIGTTITGRCELMVEGESTVRPCTEVKLELQAVGADETRQALIDGFNFRVMDLGSPSYRVVASSGKYEISADSRELSPGQSVLIRLRAKPLGR